MINCMPVTDFSLLKSLLAPVINNRIGLPVEYIKQGNVHLAQWEQSA